MSMVIYVEVRIVHFLFAEAFYVAGPEWNTVIVVLGKISQHRLVQENQETVCSAVVSALE